MALGDVKVDFGELKTDHRSDEIGSITRALMSHLGFLRRMSQLADNIKSGNFDEDFEVKNENDVLGQSLIEMKENLSQIIGETNFVVKVAGEEGNLKARVNSTDKSGAWLRLSESINDLLESVSQPFFSINNILGAMAKGDLTLRYENTILMLDRTLESYRIPENSKLSFILRRRSIDFNSPTIYDSPVSIKQVKTPSFKETRAFLTI